MAFMGSRRLLAFAGLAVWRILAVAGVGKNILFLCIFGQTSKYVLLIGMFNILYVYEPM